MDRSADVTAVDVSYLAVGCQLVTSQISLHYLKHTAR